MTRRQAQLALLGGKTITHPFYPGDKFEISGYTIDVIHNIFGSTEKHKTSWEKFWKQHQAEQFYKEWKIVENIILTIDEAKKALASGLWVTHNSFPSPTKIRMVTKHISGGIISSIGTTIGWYKFWKLFGEDSTYKTGWLVVPSSRLTMIGQMVNKIVQEPQNSSSLENIQKSITPSWHSSYLSIAKEIAKHSKDKDRKVGCVVVKDNSIISFGYNGTPHGFDNNCKDANGKTKPEVIHAESNAITKCAKSTVSITGASMYSTLACCVECAKLIIQCDVKEFYYSEAWKDSSGIELLNKAGILTKHIP